MQKSENMGDRRIQPKAFFFRKKLLIMPGFQLTLIGVNCSIITVVFGVLAIRFSQTFSEMTPLIGLSGASADLGTKLIAYQSQQMTSLLGISYVVAMISSALITLVLSYRFAGPIVRLRSYFESLGRPGQPLNDLTFRAGDFFGELPPTINTALHRIKGLSPESGDANSPSEAARHQGAKNHLRIAR